MTRALLGLELRLCNLEVLPYRLSAARMPALNLDIEKVGNVPSKENGVNGVIAAAWQSHKVVNIDFVLEITVQPLVNSCNRTAP